ncbi:MAG: TolC family protein [Bacteroidota bacterium]
MKKYIIVFVLLLNIINLKAQQNSELMSLINESFNYYPKLKELQQAELITAERLKTTQSNYLPNVNGSVSYNYVDPVSQSSFPVGPGVTRILQFQPNNNFNANIAASYVLLDFGRLKSAVEKSKEELNYSKQNTQYNKVQLAAQVANIYYYVVYLTKAVAIQDSVINYYKQNKIVIESRLKNGDALKVDLFNIDASIDNEENRKVDLKNLLQKQLNLLEFTTGKSSIQLTQFDFSVKNGSIDDYIKLAESQNSEYALVKSKITQAQLDVKYNKRQLTPTLNASANAGFKNGYQPDIFENRFNYLAGLSLNVPIYSGGKNKSQVAVAQQSLKQTEYSLQSLNNLYRKDIKQAITDVASNEERLKNAESQIKSAQSVLELTQSRYRNGVATYLDLNYAANGIQRAALSKLQFEYQLCVAKIELAKLCGEKYW